ncbi:MAG: endonuclease VII domain-containing protein [Candidatus Hodarchaeota archaeon]
MEDFFDEEYDNEDDIRDAFLVQARDGLKVCSNCREEKKATSKYFHLNCTSMDGLHPECKECRKERDRWYYIKKKYGLTKEDFYAMLESQDYLCEICEREFDDKIRPQIDHNHKTGEVREILCAPCNALIGLANDDIRILKNAIEYLKYHS